MKSLALTALTLSLAAHADHVWLHDGEAIIRAEIAADDASRMRGLMYRPWLAPGTGMLFLFDPPQHLATPCLREPCAHYPGRSRVAYVLETRARYRLIPPTQPLRLLAVPPARR